MKERSEKQTQAAAIQQGRSAARMRRNGVRTF
jgi:hypothetical protein